MRARKAFFLAVCSFFAGVRCQSQCIIDPNAIVSDACTSYASLESLHSQIKPLLFDLTQDSDFFAYYRLNLYNKECPFWTDEQSLCGNRACAVDTIEDEKDIPLIWRAEELSKLEGARAEHPGPALQKKRPKQRPLDRQLGEDVDESCVLEDDDECDVRDYCVPEDEGAKAKGDYVSLVNNTERFTGYSGPGAWQVWNTIYQENCFTPETQNKISAKKPASGRLHAANELRTVFQEYGRHRADSSDDAYPLDDECLEQRAFYRIISGMHSSISTHICWDYFNQTTGQWVRNLQCYQDRLHKHPERISNLYFNYALVSRAIAKLKKPLQHYTFCSGDQDQDYETKQRVLGLIDQITAFPSTFDESVMFKDPEMLDLKDDFKQRFRNVSRIMDCVGCDKCRLWGKVQTAGYGAALKVLFEFDETKNGENPHLRRTELVALINTLGRLSHSIEAIQKFRLAVSKNDLAVLEGKPVGVSDPVSDHAKVAALPELNKAAGDADAAIDDDPVDAYLMKEKPRNGSKQQPTIWEEIKSEWNLVWRTYMMVLRSWWGLPFKMFSISVMELNRLWNFWLGLPVPPRSWTLHFPTRDEL